MLSAKSYLSQKVNLGWHCISISQVTRLRLLGDQVHSTRIAFVEFAMVSLEYLSQCAINWLQCTFTIFNNNRTITLTLLFFLKLLFHHDFLPFLIICLVRPMHLEAHFCSQWIVLVKAQTYLVLISVVKLWL